MVEALLILTALLIAIYSVLVYFKSVLQHNKTRFDGEPVQQSMLFLVKNQEDIIEGLIRKVYAEARDRYVEVIVIDLGSIDQTGAILDRLARNFFELKIFKLCEDHGVPRRVYSFCRGRIIYSFDLTAPINYSLMAKTLQSILSGSQASLYRTKVLYKNETPGRCNNFYNVLK